ncbi:S4 domain protein YaaA [Thermoactinomyces sp. DSM 45891]|uniref:S4 domain protein YaaA n=1 Tax=Croceifilum oryzae TaxID=1553429 RepID=A0AAJ1TJ45_9BACL|nr:MULTISPECIES: S4 domain-containing protein YaaA [Thermoactinomycetaceae]MDQ0417877.1 S4 domain protein YaaA [Croceifilum oryzae]SFX31193.1 S4 domain protein YaaA [Thermoactinomyces sp. DSM 45891]
MKHVYIDGPYIQLGQLLKKVDAIDSGGFAKMFLADNEIYVNQELENRRGRKIYPQDVVDIRGFGRFLILSEK